MLWDVDHQCFSELMDILILLSMLSALHKYIVQNSSIIFRAIWEIIKFFLIPSENHFSNFSYETPASQELKQQF